MTNDVHSKVNSTVPIVSEVLKARNVYDPKRVFGVTTLDVVRASRFISQLKGSDPSNESVTVVGGHSGVTIVPLLSQTAHPDIAGEARDALVKRIQFGGDEVVKAKDGAGSATLSMAMAGARFADSLLRAADGSESVVEPSFVASPLYADRGVDYFSSRVRLGKNGAEEVLPIGKINDYETGLIEKCLEDLKKNITKGVEFVKSNP